MTYDLSAARWVRSRACSSDGCVEVARLADGGVALRDSKDAGKAAHVFDREEWTAFITGVKNGEFDPAD
ncbi:MAG TPA: DUF397 domain-containing protein [Streptosporangiaceae bacterium]|jgi:Domain of unknown function (DUF397)|nr:DUF397 domain-containing protein [Streptosporangiaceae bacterium]